MSEILTPFVYWAQNKNKINLKVELKNAKVSNYIVYYLC